MEHVLGVILARGGSVGLPGKHLRPLMGKAVIEYTFEHARAAETLTRVVVSTDCAGVRSLAAARGFDVIERPPELATGDASVQDVLLHAVRAAEQDDGFRADAVVTLYGNVPLRGAGVIDAAVRKLAATGCDSVRSFCPVGKWHPGWMSRLDGDTVVALRPGSVHRRQDLEPLYLHDGAALAVTRESLFRGLRAPDDPHAFFGTDRRGIETLTGDTVEVDHDRDLFWAEAVLRERAAAAPRAGHERGAIPRRASA